MVTDKKLDYCSRRFARKFLHNIVDTQIRDFTLINYKAELFEELIARLHTMVDGFADQGTNLTHFYHYFDTCINQDNSAYYWFVYAGEGEKVSLQQAMGLVNWTSEEFSLSDMQTEFDRGVDDSGPDAAFDTLRWALKHEFMMKIAEIFHAAVVNYFGVDWSEKTILISDDVDPAMSIVDMDKVFVKVWWDGCLRYVPMGDVVKTYMDQGYVDIVPAGETPDFVNVVVATPHTDQANEN